LPSASTDSLIFPSFLSLNVQVVSLIWNAACFAVYQSTVPFHPGEPWSGTITPLLWVAIAAVNAGAWALGLGIGTTLHSRLTRTPTRIASPTTRDGQPG